MEFIPLLREQARKQSAFPVTFLCLIQTEFNESFLQLLERRKRVRWTNFKNPRQALTMRKFCPEIIALPGGARSTRTI